MKKINIIIWLVFVIWFVLGICPYDSDKIGYFMPGIVSFVVVYILLKLKR
jgi:hypothetical protein